MDDLEYKQMREREQAVVDRVARDLGNSPVQPEKIEWINISEVIDVLEKMRRGEWTWMNNPKCKYLNVRIDMRDGHCLIKDKDNALITANQLNAQ